MHLRNGSLLQGGKYRIEKVLGQGGFGITYLGVQVGLNRQVAIKEFFMKEYCNREEDTSHVTVPSIGSRELVVRFRQKFMKEAQTIAGLENNHHIVRVTDVFEENETAYYVMEYLPGGDLRGRIPKGGMAEAEALGYIRQLGEALDYIHRQNILHLDVKPSNVLFRSNGEAVLIDFGISKHYDEDGGGQTSSTPVGLSEGYAPTEQYEREGISSFSASTDIYSLGATLYCLLQGSRPPKASIVLNEGLPSLPSRISSSTRNAIEAAMQPRRKDRPQRVDAFLALLDAPAVVAPDVDDEETEVVVDAKEVHSEKKPKPLSAPFSSETDDVPHPSPKKWFFPLMLCLVAGLCIFGLRKCLDSGGGVGASPLPEDTLLLVDTIPEQEVQEDEPIHSNQVEDSNEEAHSAPKVTQFYASTFPSGASVYVDGKYLGKTPIKDKEISLGSHTIKITLDGYKAYSKKSTFVEKPFILSETLEALPVEPAPTSSASAQPAPSKSVATGVINGHEWVDLGLSVKWATMNVGASSPSDYGSYFAWGETRPKSEYTADNCVTWNKDLKDISGNSSYDAARSNWGGSWRLPTKSELEELKNKCKWTWSTQNGRKGYTVTGPNGNSIFLPAASGRVASMRGRGIGVYGYYWSSTPDASGNQSACYLYFDDDSRRVDWYGRHFGLSVRAVAE